jgi:hypothetical protein
MPKHVTTSCRFFLSLTDILCRDRRIWRRQPLVIRMLIYPLPHTLTQNKRRRVKGKERRISTEHPLLNSLLTFHGTTCHRIPPGSGLLSLIQPPAKLPPFLHKMEGTINFLHRVLHNLMVGVTATSSPLSGHP